MLIREVTPQPTPRVAEFKELRVNTQQGRSISLRFSDVDGTSFELRFSPHEAAELAEHLLKGVERDRNVRWAADQAKRAAIAEAVAPYVAALNTIAERGPGSKSATRKASARSLARNALDRIALEQLNKE